MGPAVVALTLVTALVLTVSTPVGAGTGREPGFVPSVGGCDLFPVDSYWHADVSQLPVHPRSDDWVDSIGADARLKADFGSGLWNGGPIGIPHTTVDGDQPTVPVSFLYDDESDPGPYPIPPDAPIEGGPAATGDRHVLVTETGSCTLYELYDAHPVGGGTSWTAGSGAVWDLTSNDLRPAGWTSADAAGLPILPGLVRYEEAAAGAIDHAIRVTVPRTQRAHLWPARHFASSSTDPALPPMGAWFRLKSDVDVSGYSGPVRAVLEAARVHGLIVADNGSPWYLSGEPDERWDNDALRALLDFRGADFEAVDTSSLMVDPDSGAVGDPFGGLPAHGFSDVPRWVEHAVRWARADDVVSGWPDGTFRPDRPVTRGQFVHMLHGLAGRPTGGSAHGLTDVPPWLEEAVRWVVASGHATGFPDGTFRGDRALTRAQATRMLHRMAGSPTGGGPHGLVDVPPWIEEAVRWLVGEGHASGWPDATYRPDATMTRAQLTAILFALHG